jgi:hypothetical protein
VLANAITITPQLVAEHGLKPDEYQRFLTLMGREPTLTELGILGADKNNFATFLSDFEGLGSLLQAYAALPAKRGAGQRCNSCQIRINRRHHGQAMQPGFQWFAKATH